MLARLALTGGPILTFDQAAFFIGLHMVTGAGIAVEEALALAERIRRRVGLTAGRDPGARVTASIGVASCPDDALDYDRLFELADRRLYEAKTAGRNCVVGRRVVTRADMPLRLREAG